MMGNSCGYSTGAFCWLPVFLDVLFIECTTQYAVEDRHLYGADIVDGNAHALRPDDILQALQE